MEKVTRVWAWIYPHASHYREITLDELKKFCKENNYVISKGGKLFDFNEYTFKPDIQPIRQYCFTVGHIECSPSIDLVPRGTAIIDGYYKFPNKNDNQAIKGR